MELEAEVEEGEGGDDAEAEGEPPGGAEVRFVADEHQDHGDEVGEDEAQVDLHVGEHDEPAVAVAGFELAGAFGAGDAAGWVFASVISVSFAFASPFYIVG